MDDCPESGPAEESKPEVSDELILQSDVPAWINNAAKQGWTVECVQIVQQPVFRVLLKKEVAHAPESQE